MPIHGMGMAYECGWVKVCLAYQEDSSLLLRCGGVCARAMCQGLSPKGIIYFVRGKSKQHSSDGKSPAKCRSLSIIKRACGRDWSLALEREHGSSAVLVHTSKLYALPPQISL